MPSPSPESSPSYAVVSVGEILVDLTQVGTNEYGVALYERNPGGAPANLAAAVAKLGLPTAFVGTVGNDPMGGFLIQALQGCDVDTRLVTHTDEACTTMAFATMDPATDGFTYSFVRKPGADQLLRRADLPQALPQATRILHLGTLSLTDEPSRSTVLALADVRKPGADQLLRRADLPQALPQATRILHLGTLSLTDEPSRSTVLALADEARAGGTLVSCDANARPHAWPSLDDALRETLRLIERTDLLKVSEEEACLLCATNDLARAAEHLLGLGPRLVAITLAQNGALLVTPTASAQVEAFSPVEVLDTTGAGDSFWGACLTWLVREARVRTREDVARLDADRLRSCARYGCTAASITVERPGGMTSSPTADEVATRLALW